MKTKTRISTIAVTAAGCLLGASMAQAGYTIQMGWSSVPGSTVTFHGDSFTINQSEIATRPFSAYQGDQWHVTTEVSGSTGVGLLGWFNNDVGGTTFNYLPPGSPSPSGVYTTHVTTPTTVSIKDAQGYVFTGTMSWEQLITWTGGNGGMNLALIENITPTGTPYAGNNAELKDLVAFGGANLEMTFAFSPGLTLAQLSNGGTYTGAYSGLLTVDPAPESGTAVAGAAGLGIVVLLMALQRRSTTCVKSIK